MWMALGAAMLTPIADRAGKSFPLHAHTEGFARWKTGAVSIEEETATSVVAKVRGQRTRDVVLRDEKGRLLVGCSCPARTFELPGCKHAWAALLEIDRRGALPNLRTTRASLPVAFLEAPTEPPAEPEPVALKKKKKQKEKKEKKEAKTVEAPAPLPESGRTSRRSARGTSAPPAEREKPRRSLRRASKRRR
jgi:hypothetical protein